MSDENQVMTRSPLISALSAQLIHLDTHIFSDFQADYRIIHSMITGFYLAKKISTVDNSTISILINDYLVKYETIFYTDTFYSMRDY